MRVSALWSLVLVLAVAAPAAGQPSIAVIVNGSPISLAAPAFSQAGQVMIPAARVFEAFSAGAVWLPAERTVLITNRTGAVIRLRVGDTAAVVNGTIRQIPVAPVLVGDLPFVPAQPVFAALGAWVRYDDASRTLHVASQITALGVSRDAGTTRVVLDATGPLRPQMQVLSSPDRLVVDLHGGAFRPPDQDLPLGDAGVARVRAAQFQIKPYITRVVFDLTQPVDARITTAADSFALTIEVRPRGAGPAVPSATPSPSPSPQAGGGPAPTPAPVPSPAAPVPPLPPASTVPPAPPTPPAPTPTPGAGQAPAVPFAPADQRPGLAPGLSPHGGEPWLDDGIPRVLQVRVEQTGSRFRILIDGTMPLGYTVRELVDPDRIVVDIEGAIFIPIKQEIPVAGAAVAEVRAAQFNNDPLITRVVVVMRRRAAYTVTASNPDGSTVAVEIPEPSLRGHVVTIDAGHGGRDPGAIGPSGLHEKEVVLDIAQRLRELLVASGVRVVMTRETDMFVELADRPRIARQQGATAFVSIHANASTRPGANGSETYYLTPQSLVLAQMMQDELGRIPGLPNRGVKTANFLVLRDSDVPAVLVEVAYLSNSEEESKLRTPAFRQRLAEAVARAVSRFLAIYPVPSN